VCWHRLLCIFGSGGEHLHSVCSPRKGSALQHVVWLDDHHVSAATATEVTVWRVTQDACEESGMFGANPAGSILSLAPAPDGRYLAAACNNGTVRGWPVVLGGASGSSVDIVSKQFLTHQGVGRWLDAPGIAV
jgi:hypothetical protein